LTELVIDEQLSSYTSEIQTNWIQNISNNNDGDITVFFLTQNSLLYDQLNTDPIFAATTKADPSLGNYYLPDKLVSVLGCVDQHQWCSVVKKPGKERCSTVGSLDTLSKDLSPFADNNRQLATANRIYQSIWLNNMWYVVDPRGVAALQASKSVFETFQHNVSNTQWTIEVSGWFNTALAKLQQTLVEIAVGPGLQNSSDFLVTRPASAADQALCNAQVVRSSGAYLNFSVLGIALIVAFSTFLIWLSFIIDTATGWAQRWLHKGEDRRLQWRLEDKLQLQRMAYVGAHQGNWEGHDESVPVMTDAQLVDMSLYLPANGRALAEARLTEMTQKDEPASGKRRDTTEVSDKAMVAGEGDV
jgi:hypothetical protein